MFDLTTILLILLGSLIIYGTHHQYSYWSRRGIRGPRAIFPFGYVLYKALYRPNDIEIRWAQQYGKVYGVYTGLAPTLTVLDTHLIKQICISDFSSFTNRRHMNSYHELWNENLFMATDSRWRRLRAITSPAFTLAKLRQMIPLMEQCVNKLVEYFDRILMEANSNERESAATFIVKTVFAGYTIDVISLVAFATETNANGESSSPLVENGKKFFELNPLKILTILVLPRWALNKLGIRQPFNTKTFDYFVAFASHVLQQRKKEIESANELEKRNDLIQLLIDSCASNEDNFVAENSQTTNNKLTDTEIIAQILLFLGAGFETTAATLTHCIFELVRNETIQERLAEELKQTKNQNNSDNYLDHCPYLEAVLKETLRKYPPVVRLERRVGVEGYKLGDLTLEKGTLIEIPPAAVHYCPDYYPDPYTFNPDRFMPTNAHLLVPYSFLPFGIGPRNCIGYRFALQEMKLCLAAILTRFEFTPTPSTPKELDFIIGIPMLNAKPFEVQVVRRR